MWLLKTKKEITRELAERCRTLRLEQNLSQEELANRAGIALRTYRRFEQDGSISRERFLGVVQSLNRIPALRWHCDGTANTDSGVSERHGLLPRTWQCRTISLHFVDRKGTFR